MDALELQILQFREEVRSEFSATRAELRAEMRALHADAVARAQAGDEETRRFMRVLHEEVLERISRIGEGRSPTS